MADKNRQLVDALEREWRDALCHRDMEKLRELVHPDFVLIGTRSSGPFIMHRGAWLEAIQRREVDDIIIEVHDATATDQMMLGTVLAKWRVKYLGRIIEDCVILTDVWVQEEGRWRALRRHSTPAPAGTCPEG